ncbi:MAG: hypothetical protein GY858_02255 [Candidatus Omnitrophica bacterium]|nr:hypothetical protein [Candidatus Omnitrophota bacterium]
MRLFVLLVMVGAFFAGCEATQQAAEGVGAPIGAITKTVGGVTDGAREAYADQETDNPYNR